MRTMKDLWERNARYFPQREALVDGVRRYTHAEFASRARRLASGLYALGARRQDRVAILAQNCAEFYEAYAATEYGALMLVPLNFRLAPPEVAYVLKDSGATLLIYDEVYEEVVQAVRAEVPEIRHTVRIGRRSEGVTDYESLVGSGDDAGPPVEPAPHDLSVIWYTSGTTGKPKGAVWTQAAVVSTAQMNARVAAFDGSCRTLQVTPAFHIGGRGYILSSQWDGGAAVIHKAFDPLAMLQTIERERITHTFMVAAMVQAVLAVPGVEKFDLSSLRTVFSASAPIPVPLLRRAIELMGPVFSLQYGCTEIGAIAALPRFCVQTDGPPEVVARLGATGFPVAEIEFRLLDDAGRDCAAGTPGEVVVRSPSAFAGYWNNSNATTDVLRDGWYYTGDIGVQDAEGCLFLVDRKKDMIISGGENVYSREVEEAIASHPDVTDCAVIGMPDPKWVEVVRAVVVRRTGATLDEAAMIEHCRARIARYKCPRVVTFVEVLPRLATGKIDKPALRAQYRDG